MFSRMVPPNSVASWGTSPICARRLDVVDVADIGAVHPDGPPGHVPQPRDEPHEGRLAGARRPHQREHLACRHVEVDVAQDRARAVVREGDALELDAAGDRAQVHGVRRVVDRRLGVDDLEHALDGAGALAQLAVEPCDRGEARADRDAVQQEPRERPDRQPAGDDLVARVPEQDGDRAEAEEAHQPAEPRPPQREPRARRDDPGQVARVARLLVVLADIALDDADARPAPPPPSPCCARWSPGPGSRPAGAVARR